jgi:hypothetical protein
MRMALRLCLMTMLLTACTTAGDGTDGTENTAHGSDERTESTNEPDPGAASDPGQAVDDRGDQPIDHGADLRRSQVGLPPGWEGERSGQVVSTHDGQVIENLDVQVSGVDPTAAIDIVHDDVTVRHVRVSHADGRNGVRFASDTTGGRVEFSEFDGENRTQPAGNFGSIGVFAEGVVDVHRNYFQGGRDGVHANRGPSAITENWVENLNYHAQAHNDGFFYLGADAYADITFARNRTVAGNSGGVDLYALNGPVQGVEVLDNLVVGQGVGFGIYGGRSHTEYEDNRDVRIEGNRFIGEFGSPSAIGEGTNAGVDPSFPKSTFENNRWLGDEKDLPARCGVRQDECE